jgi:hypothetical protein
MAVCAVLKAFERATDWVDAEIDASTHPDQSTQPKARSRHF